VVGAGVGVTRGAVDRDMTFLLADIKGNHSSPISPRLSKFDKAK
jgi:hypothetical protein